MTTGEPKRLRCAVMSDYQNAALRMADWSQITDRVDVKVFDHNLSEEEALVALKDFEILALMRDRLPLPRSLIERLPKLKLIIFTGHRNWTMDMQAANDHNIIVCNTGSTGAPTASLTYGLIIELLRKVGYENARMKAGEPWQVTIGADLEGLTLGVVGLGKLGTRVAEIGKAFRMNVIAWSQNLTEEKCKEVGIKLATKEQLFAQSDVVTLHYVLSDRSRGLVGAKEIASMKPSSYIVNTSRAQLIEEAPLMDALRARRIAGAGLDVFWKEPLAIGHELRSMDNVVLTPHLGYVAEKTYRWYYGSIVSQIAEWLDGKPPTRQIQ